MVSFIGSMLNLIIHELLLPATSSLRPGQFGCEPFDELRVLSKLEKLTAERHSVEENRAE